MRFTVLAALAFVGAALATPQAKVRQLTLSSLYRDSIVVYMLIDLDCHRPTLQGRWKHGSLR